jgi:hypothetical protein
MVLQLTVADKSTVRNFKVLLNKFHTGCAGGSYAEKMTQLCNCSLIALVCPIEWSSWREVDIINSYYNLLLQSYPYLASAVLLICLSWCKYLAWIATEINSIVQNYQAVSLMYFSFPMCSLNFQARNCLETTWIHSLCSLDEKDSIRLSSRSWQMVDSGRCKFISAWVQIDTLITLWSSPFVNSSVIIVRYVGATCSAHCGKPTVRQGVVLCPMWQQLDNNTCFWVIHKVVCLLSDVYNYLICVTYIRKKQA